MSTTDDSEYTMTARAAEKVCEQIREDNNKNISRIIPFIGIKPKIAESMMKHLIGQINDEEYRCETEKELCSKEPNLADSNKNSVSLKVKGIGSSSGKRKHVGGDVDLFDFVNSETGQPHIPHVRERLKPNERPIYLPPITAESNYYDYEMIISKLPHRKDRLFSICKQYLSEEELECKKISIRSNCEELKRCLKDYAKGRIDNFSAGSATSVE